MGKLNYNDVKNFIESNKDYILISKEYINYKSKLTIRHLKCGKDFNMSYNHFKRGQRCSHCNKTIRKTTKQYKLEVFKKYNGEYEILGDYKNNRTPIKTKHVCGHEWSIRPDNLLIRGHGCPKCNGGVLSNVNEFKVKVENIYKNEYEVIGDYIGAHKKIKMKHAICGYEWSPTPSNFLSNRVQCPKCTNIQKASKGEKEIMKWLDNNNFEYEREYSFDDCISINKLRFDFKVNLPNNNFILIEYDGEQHFKETTNKFKGSTLEEIQKRDRIKNEYCKNKNYKLLRIKYLEFKNIAKILCKTFNDYPNDGTFPSSSSEMNKRSTAQAIGVGENPLNGNREPLINNKGEDIVSTPIEI